MAAEPDSLPAELDVNGEETRGFQMDEVVTAHPEGATVRLRVVPRARRTRLAGGHGDALKLRVKAPPVEGAANDEVCRFPAGEVGVRPSEVSIVAGGRGRDKVALVRGVSAQAVRRALGPSPP